MRISFAVTVHNEGERLGDLLAQLRDFIEENDTDDEIVILDDFSTDADTVSILEEYASLSYVTSYQHALERDFGAHKSYLNALCKGDYIFQIDADETLSPDLLDNLHDILNANSKVDLFLVPRVNTVMGLTDEHIREWNWRVNDRGWIMWPDYQTRLYRNSPEIMWIGRVHERIDGFDAFSHLPAEETFALLHHKHIDRQEAQNAFYAQILQDNVELE
jgi:glycosyltransferase involved in cell wall biosynthesis